MNLNPETVSLNNAPKQKEKLINIIFREKIILCTLAFLSLIVGYNNTSFSSIMNTSLNEWSSDFLPDHHDVLAKLPPVLYHLGGVFGTIMCFLNNSFNYKQQMIVNLTFLLGAYAITYYPYFLVVAGSRFIIGFTSSFLCAIIPQLLHSIGNEDTRSILMAIYPFFNLLGLTAGAALKCFDTSNTFRLVLLGPITLCLMLIVVFVARKNILPAVREEKVNLRKLWFLIKGSTAVKSVVSIIVLQIILRCTGIDLLMLFSGSVFESAGSYFAALIPLFIAVACAPFSGILPKYIKRKILLFSGLISIAVFSLCFFIFGPHVAIASLFIIFYHGVIGTIPDLYKNEVIPLEYKPMANILGTFVSWFLGFLITLFIAFVYTKQSNTIWIIFFTMTLIGAILVLVFMKETKGLVETDWLESWINLGFSNKRKQTSIELGLINYLFLSDIRYLFNVLSSYSSESQTNFISCIISKKISSTPVRKHLNWIIISKYSSIYSSIKIFPSSPFILSTILSRIKKSSF